MPSWDARNFLIRATLRREKVTSFTDYPFSIPAIGGMDSIEFDRPVTFFLGENGSGKSTLLEAIAVGMGLNAEGGSRNFRFATRESHSSLSNFLRLARSVRRPRDSYFLRAESYFNVATEIEALDSEPAAGPPIIESYGGKSLHEQSHGESFFALFMNRLRGNGLYFFDEPEAALSPTRQLSFLSRLHDLVKGGSQFLIATHSPILLAYPDAAIHVLDGGPPQRIEYRDTEHYGVTRTFLNDTERMLDILLDRKLDPQAP
jgi:predicted ATPase